MLNGDILYGDTGPVFLRKRIIGSLMTMGYTLVTLQIIHFSEMVFCKLTQLFGIEW